MRPIQYGDRSFSLGYFRKDKLTITSQDMINDFYFGCGQDNEELFRGVAGLLGLVQDKLSLVSQATGKYGKVSSYCLPSQSSSVGHFTFGNDRTASNAKHTPFSVVGNS
ncbi:putative aspartic peptidase A1 family, aspartic peptidase domain superfamily, xylanase inhibitor [Helianthus anomalus]